MAKKNAYQQANEDIAAIIAEAKSRKGWTDKDIGKLIGSKGIKAESVKNNRSRGVFPNMRLPQGMMWCSGRRRFIDENV